MWDAPTITVRWRAMPSTSADTPHRLRVLPSWLVGKVALHAQRLVADALAHSGLRRSHYAVLAALDEQGPLSQAELGRRVWMDRSDLHGIVNDLESEGLVARGRDPRDRRRNLVELTPDGTAALEQLDAEIETAQRALLEPLSAAERRTLRTLLTRLVEHHR